MTITKSAKCAVIAATALLLPVAAHAQTLTTLYSFTGVSGGSSDGANPFSVGLTKVGASLYGTTATGGTAGNGTVFKINPQNGAETVLYAFGGGSDGNSPIAGLLSVRGKLYGTTSGYYGGGFGTVFKINPKTGTETVLHSFAGGSDGAEPWSALIDVGGMLYGTTVAGGTSNAGTVFTINPKTGAETLLYSFSGGNDGQYPYAGLINVGGVLYGTTKTGGTLSEGTIFKIDLHTGAETVVYNFQGGNDGAQPSAPLIKFGGSLYGTTVFGGSDAGDTGTVFKFDLTTGVETVVHAFVGGSVDGSYPVAALVKMGGSLYGTAVNGGPIEDAGAVFAIDPATGGETILHFFTGINTDGATPYGSLISDHGVLYGTTFVGGGTHYAGTVFSVTP